MALGGAAFHRRRVGLTHGSPETECQGPCGQSRLAQQWNAIVSLVKQVDHNGAGQVSIGITQRGLVSPFLQLTGRGHRTFRGPIAPAGAVCVGATGAWSDAAAASWPRLWEIGTGPLN